MLNQYTSTSVRFIFFLFVTFSLSIAFGQQTQTFNFTGGTQTWTVPPCVYNIQIAAAGAQGGGTNGGNGAIVTTTISVCPGDQIEMTVGGQGGPGDNSGGFNGGGSGFTSSDGDPGNNSFGGGGATNVSLNGTLLMVAAGGGGTGGGTNTADGGDGGCNAGTDGDDTFGDGGGGGTQTAGGTGGAAWTGNTLGQPGQNGAMNQGGDGGFWDTASGGGGGGGYYGGGGGGSDGCCTGGNGGGGGGGGSSLVPAGGNCNQGGHVGNGNVVINYTPFNNPPTGNAPANLTVECTADIPAPDPTTVTGLTADPCGNFPTVTHLGDVSDNNTCPEVITRTYRVEDDCGNFIEVDQVITVDDTQAPTITGTLNLITDQGCSAADATAPVTTVGNLEAMGVTIDDNCTTDPNLTVTSTETSAGTCPIVITRTYTIEDECGNTSTVDQTLEVDDTQAPTITGTLNLITDQGCTAADATAPVTTVANLEAMGVTIGDNCTTDANLTVTSTETTAGTCPIVITRTYTIEDECGNTSTVDQTLEVDDTQAPTITGTLNLITDQGCTAADATAPVTTVANLEAMGVTIGDNCTADVNLTVTSTETAAGTCPIVITRTYTVEDECGNTSTVDQTLEVEDTQAPTASNPATTTVQCASDVPATDPTVVTDEADNCTANPTVTFISETTDNNVCDGEELTRVYEIEDDCNNTTTVTHTIIIDAYTPTFTLAGTDPTVCGGADGSITISGLDPNTDYDVSYGGGPTVTITTDGAGEYVVNGLSAGSYSNFEIAYTACPQCFQSSSTVIDLEDPNAPPVDGGPDQEVCEGEQVTLTATNPNNVTISWDNGITDGTAFTPGVGTTIYTVTADDAGCISTDQVEVTVHPLPNVDAGNDITICEGETVTLSGSGANSYTWDNGVVDGVSFTPNTTTTYTVTGTSAEGCIGSDQVEVIVNPKPTVNFEADTTKGCVPLTVNITNTTAGAIDNCEYTFSDGTTYTECNVTHTFNNIGCYDISLEVENGSGCSNSSTINDMICLDNFPTAEFTYSPDELTNLNFEIEFENFSSDASTFNWMFGDGGSSNAENPVHTYPSTEEEDFYTVQLIAFSDLGCTDTTYADIPYREQLLYFVPNTFTPDDDKFNETFKPIFTSGFDPQDYKLLIFNRWGETIFESNNAEVGWDGTYGTDEKEIVKDGTYVWRVEFKTKYDDERKVEVGHVNVLK